MTGKPETVGGYSEDSLALVRSTCLYVATILGDLLDDVVIVGGLVPSLLVDQETLPWNLDVHAGTMDLDLGLSLAVLREERYRELGLRLKDAGFEPDRNGAGNLTYQRWRTQFSQPTTVDFLIPPSQDTDRGGDLRHIESDFAAIIMPGLHIAFQDKRKVELSGITPLEERVTRRIWGCGPAAFTVLKALAFQGRGTPKDAYDLSYIWRGLGVEAIARDIEPFLDDPSVRKALDIIGEDFTAHDALGPTRAARFVSGGPDDDIQADVAGLAQRLLYLLT